MRRRMMSKKNGSLKLDLCNTVLCEIATGELFQTPNPTAFSPDRYEPIGIVVIPTAHDVYGTGECGVMALMSASLSTPDTGQANNTEIVWGAYGTDYPEMVNYNVANYINNGVLATASYPYLPSDNFSGDLSDDGITKWNQSSNRAPSPYNADGSRNLNYYATGPIPTIDLVYGDPILNEDIKSDNFDTRWEVITGSWTEESQSESKDGKQFKSVSPGANGSTRIRCYFGGVVGRITFCCKYDGENNYDYLTVGNMDSTCDRSTYKESLKGKTGQVQYISFETVDTNDHYVEFCYSKDSSGDTAPDCAVVFVASGYQIPILVNGFSGSGSPYNALSDFAGKWNTEFLCSKATSQPDWKTDAAITNNSGAGYHPAACACWRFHTVGTAQGDWYLPACGELGYVCVRFKKINETISVLQSHFGKSLCLLDTHYFWSSSEYSSSTARGVGFGTGRVDNGYRYGSLYVRPFLRGAFQSRMA